MEGIKTEDIEVQSASNPELLVPAKLARCVCGNNYWFVFQIQGHSGYHLQCAHCDTSYCSTGECAEAMK